MNNNQRVTPREVEPQDIGWLAGIIDGEGTLTFGKSINKQSRFGYNYYNGVSIVNTNQEMIDKCLDIMNRLCEDIQSNAKMTKLEKKTKIYNGNNFIKPSKNGYKDCYQVTLRNKDWTIKILETITPLLTEKRRRAETLLTILKERVQLNLEAKQLNKKAYYTEEETQRYMQMWENTRRD